jgi:hypothetical protein
MAEIRWNPSLNKIFNIFPYCQFLSGGEYWMVFWNDDFWNPFEFYGISYNIQDSKVKFTIQTDFLKEFFGIQDRLNFLIFSPWKIFENCQSPFWFCVLKNFCEIKILKQNHGRFCHKYKILKKCMLEWRMVIWHRLTSLGIFVNANFCRTAKWLPPSKGQELFPYTLTRANFQWKFKVEFKIDFKNFNILPLKKILIAILIDKLARVLSNNCKIRDSTTNLRILPKSF